MDALSALPTWLQLVLAILAAVVLVILNAGWLMAAKSALDTRKQENAERRSQDSGEVKR